MKQQNKRPIRFDDKPIFYLSVFTMMIGAVIMFHDLRGYGIFTYGLGVLVGAYNETNK